MRGSDNPPRPRSAAWIPEVAGILTADQVISTGQAIAAVQQPAGAIGWPDGHVDAWNHVECAMALSVCGLRDASRRAYEWLRANQRQDGSWYKQMAANQGDDLTTEANHAAYCAVGVWHELLVTRDARFVASMLPTVRRAISFAHGFIRDSELKAPGDQWNSGRLIRDLVQFRAHRGPQASRIAVCSSSSQQRFAE